MNLKSTLLLSALFLFPSLGFSQWESLGTDIIPSGYRTYSLKIAEDHSIWVVSTYDAFPPPSWHTPKVHRSIDEGATWSTSTILDGGSLYGLDLAPIDSLNAFCLSKVNGLYKTTDGGQNWEGVVTYPYTPWAVHFFNENDGWVLGLDSISALLSRRVISLTSDGGNTWTHVGGQNWDQPPGTSLPENGIDVQAGFTFSIRSSYDYTDHSLLIGNSDGTIWISNDKGYNWQEITTPLVEQNLLASCVTLKDDQTFMVVGDTKLGSSIGVSSVSYTTLDGGGTWIEGNPGVTWAHPITFPIRTVFHRFGT
ncbi:MAG: hypothetical protein IPJ40_04730 [Saprospirales bacterium]|nr:hypothetical protein [Saprospirales bacterium]